jgi:hypothetical protein
MKKRLDRFHEEEPDSWSPLDAPRRTSGSEFRMKRFLFLLLYVLAIFVVGLANSNAHWLMAAAGFLLFSIGAPRLRSPVVSAKEVKVWTIFGIHRVSLQKYCVALTDGGGINGPYRGRTVAIGKPRRYRWRVVKCQDALAHDVLEQSLVPFVRSCAPFTKACPVGAYVIAINGIGFSPHPKHPVSPLIDRQAHPQNFNSAANQWTADVLITRGVLGLTSVGSLVLRGWRAIPISCPLVSITVAGRPCDSATSGKYAHLVFSGTDPQAKANDSLEFLTQ